VAEKTGKFLKQGIALKGRIIRVHRNEDFGMGKVMTKKEIVSAVAEAAGISANQADNVIKELVVLACKEAKNGFTVPGLGTLVVENSRQALGRNPSQGKALKKLKKPVVKFHLKEIPPLPRRKFCRRCGGKLVAFGSVDSWIGRIFATMSADMICRDCGRPEFSDPHLL
jgi:DNA-binding protein HU-beta